MHLNISLVIRLSGDKSTECFENYKPVVNRGADNDYASDFTVVKINPEHPGDCPRKCDVLVVTDEPDFLAGLPFGEDTKLYPVYIGDSADVKELILTGKIYDVWSDNEDDDIRRWRFDRVLRSIKSVYDAWLYENILTTMNDSVPDMIWFKDMKGLHWRVNDAFCEVVKKTKEDCRGRDHSYIWGVPIEEGLACQDSEEQVIKAGRTCEFEEPVKKVEGLKLFKVYKSPIYDRFGDISGTAGIGRDITNFNNMGLELSLLVENIPIPILILSTDRKTVRMNGLFGNSFIGDMVVPELFEYEKWKDTYMRTTNIIEETEESVRFEASVKIGGRKHFYVVNEKRIRDYFGNPSGYFCFFRDVTDEKVYEKHIIRMANTDALTGLYNRRYFYDYIKEHSANEMTLLYMDLDFFKTVNDTFGHTRGDEVLKKTADYIKEIYQDGIAARLGGDEYAVILLRKMEKVEFDRKEKLLQGKVRALFRKDNRKDFPVTISVGMIVSEGGSGKGRFDIDQFLFDADKKMYEVKRKHHSENKNPGTTS